MFHFNWGWGGSQNNDWFTLSHLSNRNYNSKQRAIFRIHPPSNYTQYCDWEVDLSLQYLPYVMFPNLPFYYMLPNGVPQTLISATAENSYNLPANCYTIPAGVTVEYVAHNEIVLLPGFTAEAGSNFTARIEPCDACYNTQSSQVMANVPQNSPIVSNDFITELTFVEQQEEKAPSLQHENNIEKQIILHPNPNNGTFSIDANFDLQEIIQLQIFNEFGKLVYNQNTLSRTTIQLPSSEKGLFIVKITTKFGNFTQKMLVQ